MSGKLVNDGGTCDRCGQDVTGRPADDTCPGGQDGETTHSTVRWRKSGHGRGHRKARQRATMRGERAGYTGYDNVTDAQILDRDGWECQMPVCHSQHGRAIQRGLPGDHPWRATVDHVEDLADGGTDTADNKRAAHNYCNQAAAAGARPFRRGHAALPLSESLAGNPALAALARQMSGETGTR